MDDLPATVAPVPEPREPDHESTETDESPGASEHDSEAIRDLILRAYPDVVPELIAGETADEMLSSVPEAQEAYRRVAESAGRAAPDPVPPGDVSRRPVVNVDALSPEMKIREGLR